MPRKLIAAAAILGVSAAAFAMTGADTDADGTQSLEDFAAAYPELTEAEFTAADTDANGMLDEAELAAAADSGILPETEG